MNMPAVVTWDTNGRRMQIEREGSLLRLIVDNGGVKCSTRLDQDDARAVRRYLTQWLRWIDEQS